MDIAIDSKTLQRRQLRATSRWLLGIAVLVAALLLLRDSIAPSVARNDIRTAVVERGPVSTEVIAAGAVVPKNERVLSSPLTSRISEVLLPIGSSVKQGDAMLQLDSTQVDNEIRRLGDELRLKQLETEGIAQQQQQKLRELHNQRELASIDYENQKVTLQRYDMLLQRNIVSKLDYEATSLTTKKAAMQLQQLEQQIVDTMAADQNRLQQGEITLGLLQQRLAEQQQLKHDLTIRASSDGIITLLSSEIGQNVLVGGELARISDLSSYRVDATISDFYLHQIKVGMLANVDIGGNVVTGQLERILPAVDNGTIRLQVELDNPQNAALKPNLRVEAAIVTDSRNEGLRVSNGVVFNGSGLQDIFVVQDDSRAVKRQVDIGLSNAKYVEIVSGLTEGDEIIISDMTDYQHLEQLDIDN